MQEPVTFKNQNGKKLFGVVHIPEQTNFGERRIGINLLNPGIKYRVAPNRLNVKLARKLCQNGYYVLRFDPCGIGDSEGELPDGGLVADIWEKIQTGLFVSDTIAANDFFNKNYGVNELILMGSCGGAITALLTSAKDHRVDALCLIDIPVSLRTSSMSFADKIAPEGKRADLLFIAYIKKVFRPEAWYRFITLKTEYRALWKIVSMKFRKTLFPVRAGYELQKNMEKVCSEKNLNRQFFEAFEAFYENKKPTLFVEAEYDKGTEIFETYFLDMYLKQKCQIVDHNELVEVFIVKNANHAYTTTNSQESLIGKICVWIDTRYNEGRHSKP